MPSPDKDRPPGRVGRLLAALRPSRAGPLPVQTGFPTSLADLVVKNHGRLKKQPSPSSKRRKGGGGVSASPSPSTSPSPPPSSPPPAPAVSPVDRTRADLSPDLAVRRDKSGAVSFGLGFLAVSGVVSLALLVIWSKKVVAAVTVASFSLFLLESLRCSSLPRRQRSSLERPLYLDGRGRVSPIREVDADSEPPPPPRPGRSDSERGIEAAEETTTSGGGGLEESSNSKAKTKKRSWKKLIASARKLQRGRKTKEADDDRSGSFRSEGDRSDVSSVRSNARATDSSGSRRGMSIIETDVAADAIPSAPDSSLGSRRGQSSEIVHVSPMEIDAPADVAVTKEQEQQQQQGKKAREIRFPALVLVAVALVGLVAGKLPAVAFTMLCAAFFSSVPRFPCRRGDGSRWRRLELTGSL